MNWIYLISFFIALYLIALLFKKKITAWMVYLRGKMFVAELRNAINEADKNKLKTNRKNIVVFNTTSGSFEPEQKRFLKFIANKSKNKNNAKRTEGRKKFAKPVKRSISSKQIPIIEKKSLYVTK